MHNNNNYHQMMRRKEREARLYEEMNPPTTNLSPTEHMSRILFPEYYKDKTEE